MRRRAIEIKKCKTMYDTSVMLAVLLGIASYGAMGNAALFGTSLIPVLVFTGAFALCVLAAKYLRKRIIRLTEKEMDFLIRSLERRMKYEFYEK